MGGSNEDNSKIHPEEEHLENLRFGEGKDNNSEKLCQCNARQDLQTEKDLQKCLFFNFFVFLPRFPL